MRHQKLELGVGELEHEIGGEPGEVAAHLFVQPAGLDAVERGEVGIEQNLMAAYEEDAAPDAPDRDDRTYAFTTQRSCFTADTAGRIIGL